MAVAVALLALLAGTGLGAAPQPVAPLDGVSTPRATQTLFSATVDAASPGAVQLVISTGPTRDAAGVLSGEEVAARVSVSRPPGATAVTHPFSFRRPGRYWWQLVVDDPAVSGGSLAAAPRIIDVTTTVPPPVPIPASIGTAGTGTFFVNATGVPAGLTVGRFVALASAAGTRWGLTYGGLTDRPPTEFDDVSVVGFSGALDLDALGVLVTRRGTKALPQVCTAGTKIERRVVVRRVVRIVKVRRRVTVRRNGVTRKVTVVRNVRRAVKVRRAVDVRVPITTCADQPPAAVVDRDIRIRPDVAWQEGPASPSFTQYDLESVLIHEFGHLAGNGHVSDACHPMYTALEPGDWWRGPGDFWLGSCATPGPA